MVLHFVLGIKKLLTQKTKKTIKKAIKFYLNSFMRSLLVSILKGLHSVTYFFLVVKL